MQRTIQQIPACGLNFIFASCLKPFDVQGMIHFMKTMPQITNYQFGRIEIDGRWIHADLIIFPDGRLKENWRRDQGHLLEYSDILPLINAGPDIIIVGTGAYGRMDMDSRLISQLSDIELVALASLQAVTEYRNAIKRPGSVGACFHLTC